MMKKNEARVVLLILAIGIAFIFFLMKLIIGTGTWWFVFSPIIILLCSEVGFYIGDKISEGIDNLIKKIKNKKITKIPLIIRSWWWRSDLHAKIVLKGDFP